MIDLSRPQKKEPEESVGTIILTLVPFLSVFFVLFVRAL
jgi:hypothetical protein